jgi:hypothetical protein
VQENCTPGSEGGEAIRPSLPYRQVLSLTRLRGFAEKNADFEIFEITKSLIVLGLVVQVCPESRVVKTYPISGVESMV